MECKIRKSKIQGKRLPTGDNRKSSSNEPPSLQILNGTHQESSGNIVNIDITHDKESCVSQNTFVTSEIKNITIATQTPNNFRSLSTEVLLSDDESIDFFTGLESYPKFTIVLSTLLPMAYNIEHTQGTEIGLSVKDLFLMLLIKLRRNKHDFEIGKMFGVSETEAANIIVTWINFVSEIWQLFEIWPSQELVNVYMPDVFQKNHPSTRVVIDGTNCGINIANFFKGKCQVPGLLMKQDQKLAIKRVDKERLMEFTKTYEILSSELNEHYLPLASKIFCICVMLCYFKKATINKNL
ncbi:uncharacterized protein LOC113521146 [Galleria mellonella]|uniref:Uncharacterized protein LOC113521146 n=1 Tax=Galleria mellonella TaxID=7137 RepID=A0ABM3MII9_GALME|nr:uncharacterized protein LOC113521146 [Galleria mellonella]